MVHDNEIQTNIQRNVIPYAITGYDDTELIEKQSEANVNNMMDNSRNVFRTRNNLNNILEVLDCESDTKGKHPVTETNKNNSFTKTKNDKENYKIQKQKRNWLNRKNKLAEIQVTTHKLDTKLVRKLLSKGQLLYDNDTKLYLLL